MNNVSTVENTKTQKEILYTSGHLEFINKQDNKTSEPLTICINHITRKEVTIPSKELHVLYLAKSPVSIKEHIDTLIACDNLYKVFDVYYQFTRTKFTKKIFSPIAKMMVRDVGKNKPENNLSENKYRQKIEEFITRELLVEKEIATDYIKHILEGETVVTDKSENYENKKLLIGCPTKDRPEDIKNLLIFY